MNAEWPTARLQMEDQPRPPGYRKRSGIEEIVLVLRAQPGTRTPTRIRGSQRTECAAEQTVERKRFARFILQPSTSTASLSTSTIPAVRSIDGARSNGALDDSRSNWCGRSCAVESPVVCCWMESTIRVGRIEPAARRARTTKCTGGRLAAFARMDDQFSVPRDFNRSPIEMN